MQQRTWSTVLAAAALLAAGCAATSVESVNRALADHYLEPFDSADIGYTVESTCHLEGPTAVGSWQFEVGLRIDADPSEVADILEEQGMVLRRGRDPMVVQQVPGAPDRGWNGGIESSDGGSMLYLTHSTVEADGFEEFGGWAEVC